MMSYREVEKELEKINELIFELQEKKRQLREALKKFKLPHYCPFCAGENIVKSPELYSPRSSKLIRESGYRVDLRNYYYCRDCDRAFRLALVTLRKKEVIKEALE